MDGNDYPALLPLVNTHNDIVGIGDVHSIIHLIGLPCIEFRSFLESLSTDMVDNLQEHHGDEITLGQIAGVAMLHGFLLGWLGASKTTGELGVGVFVIMDEEEDADDSSDG